MNIVLGTCTDEREQVDKNFSTVLNISNAELKQDTSIINPTIIVHTLSNIANVNYVYIPSFKRYYFVNNIVALTGGRIAIECHVDVLMSFKGEIRRCRAIINKQQHDEMTSQYIDDGSYVLQCKDVVDSINFQTGFSTWCTMLITAGGGS